MRAFARANPAALAVALRRFGGVLVLLLAGLALLRGSPDGAVVLAAIGLWLLASAAKSWRSRPEHDCRAAHRGDVAVALRRH